LAWGHAGRVARGVPGGSRTPGSAALANRAVASAYLGHGSLSTARPKFRVVSRTVSAEFLRDVFFRPWRDPLD
jgi:hypothetical protein